MALADYNGGFGKPKDLRASIVEVKEIFSELFDLLEDYAPSWYTEELHDRALASLETLRRMTETSAGPMGKRSGG
ncbi:MAG TPA: hypothetical protein VMH31_01585 [Methylomirabilota bacterium]|nr:hypothetical protein [Methylomirabilota bacterium]